MECVYIYLYTHTQLYIIVIGQIIQLYMEYLYFIDSISFNLEANQTHKFHYLKTRPKLTAQNCTRVGKFTIPVGIGWGKYGFIHIGFVIGSTWISLSLMGLYWGRETSSILGL